MNKTTSIDEKSYESSYTWKIEKFNSKCNLKSLKNLIFIDVKFSEIWEAGYNSLESDLVEIVGLEASWKLFIQNNRRNPDEFPFHLKLFNLKLDGLKARYRFSISAKGPKSSNWRAEYKLNGKVETSATIYIASEEIADSLVDGTLTLQIKVSLETVELKEVKNSVKVKAEKSIKLSNVE